MEMPIISGHADGGPRSRVCARYTLCSAPHRHERKFFTKGVCTVILKHHPNPLEVLSENTKDGLYRVLVNNTMLNTILDRNKLGLSCAKLSSGWG